jgi:predicted secreted protein
LLPERSLKRYTRASSSIREKTGRRFVIELKATAAAGYTWVRVETPPVLELRDERLRPGGAGVGAAAVQEFELECLKPGSGRLVFEYKRPWEARAEERLEVQVEVKS